jgi:hypothetical protein
MTTSSKLEPLARTEFVNFLTFLKLSGNILSKFLNLLILTKQFFKYTQWKNISITSMEQDFWGVKSIGCENLHATEVKCSNIPQKS